MSKMKVNECKKVKAMPYIGYVINRTNEEVQD